MALKPGNVIQAKAGTVARTDTSAKKLFILPAGAMPIGIRAYGTIPDNAQTLTIGTQPINSTTVTTLATVDVATTANVTETISTKLGGAAFVRQTVPVYVTGTWAEATTNTSTSGGPYSVAVEYL